MIRLENVGKRSADLLNQLCSFVPPPQFLSSLFNRSTVEFFSRVGKTANRNMADVLREHLIASVVQGQRLQILRVERSVREHFQFKPLL